ncbi:MAG TPA: hypothetical protein VIV54_02380 [Burkholderiales bacterium]
MKKAALMIAIAVALPAWGQDAKPAAKEEAKPAAAAPAAAQEATKEKPKKKSAAGSMTRRQQDARHCLDKSTNTEIIKCAEAYL